MEPIRKLHFGFNCQNLLPYKNKCRILSKLYLDRPELLELRWLDAVTIKLYMNWSIDDICIGVENKTIKTRLSNDGNVMFGIKTAWDHDECFQSNSGGQCFFYCQRQTGNIITCLADIASPPPFVDIPSESELKLFETTLIDRIKNPPLTKQKPVQLPLF